MSALLLSNNTKGSVLQDDLESFLHVLLYEGIRYLKHNCRDVGAYMAAFFDGAAFSDGQWVVGEMKSKTMQSGEFTLLGESRPFIFTPVKGQKSHPINTIVATALSWFKAYYKIQKSKKTVEPDDSLVSMTILGSRRRISRIAHRNTINASTSPSAPTQEDEVAAANLDSHTPILDLLSTWLKLEHAAEWPEYEPKDQLPAGYDPVKQGIYEGGAQKRRSEAIEDLAEKPNFKKQRSSATTGDSDSAPHRNTASSRKHPNLARLASQLNGGQSSTGSSTGGRTVAGSGSSSKRKSVAR